MENTPVEIFIQDKTWPADKPDVELLLIFQLFRIVNSLRSEHRLIAILEQNNLFPDKDLMAYKIRYELFLKQSAFLYEALKKTRKLFGPITSSEETTLRIKKYTDRLSDSNDKIIKIIRHIRDKIAFHLDDDVVTEVWRQFDFHLQRTIGVGKTPRKIDYFWSIAEDISLTYLSNINGTPDDPHFIGPLMVEIFSLADEFADACDAYIFEKNIKIFTLRHT